MWCCDTMMSTRRVQASRALWEDEGEHRHFCDSTGSLDAPLTRGVHDAEALLNWSLREQLAWGSAETHHFMFAHATGRLCTPPSNRLAAVLTTICTHTTLDWPTLCTGLLRCILRTTEPYPGAS